MAKTRILYYHFSRGLGLNIVVTKLNGSGLLRSYGEHHNTKLDELLGDKGFETVHPDNYLEVYNKNSTVYDKTLFTNEEDAKPALWIVSNFYNCSERVKLSREDFFNLLNAKK